MSILSTGQVAALCQVASRTVSNWCDAGLIKYYRLPFGARHRRISKDDLLAFARAHNMTHVVNMLT